MQYSNEVKVGVAIVVSVVVFYLGLRFFQNIPVFQERYTLKAQFEDAGGLVTGNPVEMKGVNIGTVNTVDLSLKEQRVKVSFEVDKDVQIPKGSYAEVTGFSALSGVRLKIQPGPVANDPLPPGATLGEPPEGGLLERLSDKAPELATKADTVLTRAGTTLGSLNQQLSNPSSTLQQTLRSLNETLKNVSELTGDESESLRGTLRNLETITADLQAYTGGAEEGAPEGSTRDTLRNNNLGKTVARLNRTLTRLDTNLVRLETTTTNLNELTRKMNEGDGTIGRLVNDPSLYNSLDSSAVRLDAILRDLQENPGRYLEDMTLMKVF